MKEEMLRTEGKPKGNKENTEVVWVKVLRNKTPFPLPQVHKRFVNVSKTQSGCKVGYKGA